MVFMKNKNISILSMLFMTVHVLFLGLALLISEAMDKVKISFLNAVVVVIENGLLAFTGFAFSLFTFYSNFEKFGLTSLAVVTAFKVIFSVAMLAGVLFIMKEQKKKIFSEIVTHQSNLFQLIKVFASWLFGLEFVVFLAIEPKLFSMLGVAIFVAVAILFLNYFIAGLKEGQEYNKQFEE